MQRRGRADFSATFVFAEMDFIGGHIFGVFAAFGDCKNHCANRFLRCATVWPRNAADRHGDVGVGAFQRPLGHRPGHSDRDGAECFNQLLANFQRLDLGFVGIGNKARLQHCAAARNFGQCRRDQPAGSAFRCHNRAASRAVGLNDLLRELIHGCGQSGLHRRGFIGHGKSRVQ